MHELGEKVPLLALPLVVPEARYNGASVEHDRSVGGKDHIGKARHAIHYRDAGSGLPESRGELPLRVARLRAVDRLVLPPSFGFHPRINLV